MNMFVVPRAIAHCPECGGPVVVAEMADEKTPGVLSFEIDCLRQHEAISEGRHIAALIGKLGGANALLSNAHEGDEEDWAETDMKVAGYILAALGSIMEVKEL